MSAGILGMSFINQLISKQQRVAVYLASGIKLTGTIEDHDTGVLILVSGSSKQMVYKHSIATVVPLQDRQQ